MTGASRVIGQALAVRFAAEGAKVLAVGRSLSGTGQFSGSLAETVELTDGRATAAPEDIDDSRLFPGYLR